MWADVIASVGIGVCLGVACGQVLGRYLNDLRDERMYDQVEKEAEVRRLRVVRDDEGGA